MKRVCKKFDKHGNDQKRVPSDTNKNYKFGKMKKSFYS
jgi:hypothetical protein